jgi:hypothetical protein
MHVGRNHLKAVKGSRNFIEQANQGRGLVGIHVNYIVISTSYLSICIQAMLSQATRSILVSIAILLRLWNAAGGQDLMGSELYHEPLVLQVWIFRPGIAPIPGSWK